MTDTPKQARKMPKGGRKGGSTFPRISLEKALEYAGKLVSKTHTGSQSADSIYAGVVNAKGGEGATRISALRQYSLLEGNKESGFKATDLARKIASSPKEEKLRFLRKACLNPKVFGQLFETFHGDTISRAKLRQRAAGLNVHPDELDSCVDVFIKSVSTSSLGNAAGDQVTLVGKMDVDSALNQGSEPEELGTPDESPTDWDDASVITLPPNSQDTDIVEQFTATPAGVPSSTASGIIRTGGKPNVNVSINIDSTMDPDKLAKQLELLKKFGAI